VPDVLRLCPVEAAQGTVDQEHRQAVYRRPGQELGARTPLGGQDAGLDEAVRGRQPRAGRGSGRPPRPWRGSRRSAGCPTPRTPSETAPARPGRTAGSRRRPPAGAPGRRRRGPRRSADRPTPPPSRPPARPGRPSRPRRAAHAGRRSVGTPRLAPRPPAGWPRAAPPPPARPRAPAPCPPPAARGADHRVGT
jgi:hypothetical protein